MAVSVTPPTRSEPIFGAVWLKARIETDLDSRTVEILEIEVPRVRFRTRRKNNAGIRSLADEGNSIMGHESFLDRLAAMLDLTESRRRIAEGLDDTPPKILFVSYPAILVTIDGEPQLVRSREAPP